MELATFRLKSLLYKRYMLPAFCLCVYLFVSLVLFLVVVLTPAFELLKIELFYYYLLLL
jgi:hypothetical protein